VKEAAIVVAYEVLKSCIVTIKRSEGFLVRQTDSRISRFRRPAVSKPRDKLKYGKNVRRAAKKTIRGRSRLGLFQKTRRLAA